jgi:large subunit ribosomal protein L6
MSNIGKRQLLIPYVVFLEKYKNFLIIKGNFGILKIKINSNLLLKKTKDFLLINKKNNNLFLNKIWGTTNSLIKNAIEGVFKLHFLKFNLIGVGFKALLKKNILVLRLGFSHKYYCSINSKITMLKIKNRPPTFIFKSFDLNIITQTAFILRSFKKPEPYKGKGFVFLNEFLKLKEGKKNKSSFK